MAKKSATAATTASTTTSRSLLLAEESRQTLLGVHQNGTVVTKNNSYLASTAVEAVSLSPSPVTEALASPVDAAAVATTSPMVAQWTGSEAGDKKAKPKPEMNNSHLDEQEVRVQQQQQLRPRTICELCNVEHKV